MNKTKKIVFISVIALIALVLISSTVLLYLSPFKKQFDTQQKSMLLNKPGVVFISTYYNSNLIIQSSAGYPMLSGQTYPVELGGTGTGFIINKDGYILTNGHVVEFPEDELAYEALVFASDYILDDILVASFIEENGVEPTPEDIEAVRPAVIEELGGEDMIIENLYAAYKAGEIKLDNPQREVYIQRGIFASGKKIVDDLGLKADVKATNFKGFNEQGDPLGKDLALLKVEESNMPTVQLGDSSSVKEGDKIYAIGYPGIATFQDFLSQENQLEATITSGIVSSQKSLTDGTKVFQTDAAITYGNSGGPVFNEKGEVIGIASLVAVDETGQKMGYGYLLASNLVKEFANEQNIKNTASSTDLHYSKGVNYYDRGKDKQAIKEFEVALNLYPALMEANDYKKKSQENIGDQGFSIKKLQENVDGVNLIIVTLLSLTISTVLIVLIIRKKGVDLQQNGQIADVAGIVNQPVQMQGAPRMDSVVTPPQAPNPNTAQNVSGSRSNLQGPTPPAPPNV